MSLLGALSEGDSGKLDGSDFVRLMVSEKVIQFGQFTLKSGRSSPYFFNMGNINNAAAITALGRAYAAKVVESGLKFDILFGPAYKGIPIAVSTAIALFEDYGVNVGVTFNRKEAKQHGEGGNLIGHALRGRVLILDDVITAGTAITEALGFIEASEAELAGVMVAMDRQELAEDGKTALASLALAHKVPVQSIANLAHVIAYFVESGEDEEMLNSLKSHQEAYC